MQEEENNTIQDLIQATDENSGETNSLLEHSLQQQAKNGETAEQQLETADKTFNVIKDFVDKSNNLDKSNNFDMSETNKLLKQLTEELKKKEQYEEVSYSIDIETQKKLKGEKGNTPTTEEITELIKPLIPKPIKGDDGNDYKLTENDKKEIAKTITVPVVEKIIQKTQVIKEVYKKDTAKEIKRKLQSLKTGLDYDSLSNTPDIQQIISVYGKQASKTVSLVELDDVNLTGLTLTNGKYNLGSGGGGVISVIAGTNITITGDPQNPIINSTGEGAVVSVNTKIGVVVLDTDDIAEGATNKYITQENITKLGHIIVTNDVNLDTMESDIVTNNAKVSNATHTGEVTGATALTIANNAVITARIADNAVTNAKIADAALSIAKTNGLQTALDAKESALTFSTGLTRAINTITNNLSTGVSGGQSVIGGTASGNSLTLSSTSNATKGNILFGTSVYDEVNNRLGIGATPLGKLDISGASSSTNLLTFDTNRSVSVINSNTTTNNAQGIALRSFGTDGTTIQSGVKLMAVNTARTATTITSDFAILTNNAGTISEKMRVLGNGNVGIGTTTPNTIFDARGWITSNTGINVAGNSFTSGVPNNGLNITVNGGTGVVAYSALSGGGFSHSFLTSAKQRVLINDTGLFVPSTNALGVGATSVLGRFSVTPLQYGTGTASQSGTTISIVTGVVTVDMLGAQFVFANGTSAGTITGFTNSTTITVSTSQTVASQAYTINYTGLNVRATGTAGVGVVASSTSVLSVGDTSLAGSGSLAGSLLNLTQTWNTTGIPTAILLNVINTASGAFSLLQDLQVGSVSTFSIRNDGMVSLGRNQTGSGSGFNGGNNVGLLNIVPVYTDTNPSSNSTYTMVNVSPTVNPTASVSLSAVSSWVRIRPLLQTSNPTLYSSSGIFTNTFLDVGPTFNGMGIVSGNRIIGISPTITNIQNNIGANTMLNITPTISGTIPPNGINGIQRGVYYAPTYAASLVSDANNVAWENTTGNTYFGTTSGNVGIGTMTPTSIFQVNQPTTGMGVVTNSAGGTAVTGTNTQFTNTFKVGDTITIGGQTVAISAIGSNTSMTTAAITNANTSAAYTLTGGNRFVVSGNGNVGIGTSTPAASAIVDLTSTTGALLVTRMTTAQRDALTPVNAMILYNTTTNKFQGYEGGAWVNLI